MTAWDTMTDEALLEFGLRYLQAWNDRDADAVLACLGDDVVWDDPAMERRPARGREAARDFCEMSWRAFPDLRITETPGAPAMMVAGDRTAVAIPWRLEGAFLGPLDPPGFAPTGRPFAVDGIDVWRFRGGLLAEVRSLYDLMDWSRQIGIVPGPGSAASRMLVAGQRLRVRLAGRRR